MHLNDKGLTGKNKPWRAERGRLTCWDIRAKSYIKIQPAVQYVTWQKRLIDSLEEEGILWVKDCIVDLQLVAADQWAFCTFSFKAHNKQC